MNDLLNPVTSLLVSMATLTAALAVMPLLLKIFVPVLGEQVWRTYRRMVKWMFLIPFRLLAAIVGDIARPR